MERLELYHLIGLQSEIVEKLSIVARELDLAPLAPCLEQFLVRETAPSAYQRLKALLGEDSDGLRLLYCYLECVRRAYGNYQTHRIPDQIYTDTMKCFSRFLNECEREHGRICFDRGWWAYRQTSMSLFRVGALEYEFHTHEGENVIALHIPSDADLSPASVDRSLEQAGTFFSRYFPQYQYSSYTCNSWLLSHQLRPLLSQGSNIRSFQDRFCIQKENPADMEFIQWLFQVPRNTAFPHLPERTSLQRQVKTLLLRGDTIGAAYGVMDK